MEEEHKARTVFQEEKFALRHDIETIHNCIDLIGYSGREAVEIS